MCSPVSKLDQVPRLGRTDGKIVSLSGRWLNDKEGLLEFASHKGIKLTKTGQLGKVITKLFDALVEPELVQPTFITGYPAEVSPLSRRSDQEPDLT